jgi:hypothetical protein
MMGQFAPTAENGTTPARNGTAEATTTKLVALLRMTASRPRNQNRLIRTGSQGWLHGGLAPPE